jgi:hypothetical protein
VVVVIVDGIREEVRFRTFVAYLEHGRVLVNNRINRSGWVSGKGATTSSSSCEDGTSRAEKF